MIVTVASGKGGTGKTTIAVSLALSLAEGNDTADSKCPLLLDCDVEEPNAALYLHPQIESSREVGLLIPKVDFSTCTYCGICDDICRYNAITVFGDQVLVFPDLCHGCGSCKLLCPEGSIEEVSEDLGCVETGNAGKLTFGQGILQVGKAMAVPIIHELKRQIPSPESNGRLIILDAPPGSSCPVVETMRGSDFILLVTEPTPFGLHDLRLAVQVGRDELNLPVGVVINRDGIGDKGVEDFCDEEGIPILLRIPFNRQIAEAGSEGIPLVEAMPEYRKRFQGLYASIERLSMQARMSQADEGGVEVESP
jgi:MinD superfamily P-loop ATPase